MNLKRCPKGHFYDGEKFASCPHCVPGAAASDDAQTVAMRPISGSENVTTDFGGSAIGDDAVTVQHISTDNDETQKRQDPAVVPSFAGAMVSEPVTTPGPVHELPEDDMPTRRYYDDTLSTPVKSEPVVGWLVCTKGQYFGQSFTLKSGRNFIGRGQDMDICLEGEISVSRDRHAVIVYEPKERMFLAQAGDARELFYVNDDVVLDHVVLKPNDIISLGKVDLMIIPCCTKEFAWEDLEKKENGQS
ncbi:MAG: FHA domain-containing protein [Clostridiales bacterium]|nr:FHA domain-containing protein [Clostridiales bacterium]